LWGTGTTSSSDGQYFRAGGRGEKLADINARHGNEPGVTFYTHLSDQFGPYYTKVIAATASEAPHVLDGLLYHQTGLQIEEHYTDTGGATDRVFGLCHLFGFRIAPRIRDLKDRRLYLFPGQTRQPILDPLVGGFVDLHHITAHWNAPIYVSLDVWDEAEDMTEALRKMQQEGSHTEESDKEEES
jgi:TnpA family transposase